MFRSTYFCQYVTMLKVTTTVQKISSLDSYWLYRLIPISYRGWYLLAIQVDTYLPIRLTLIYSTGWYLLAIQVDTYLPFKFIYLLYRFIPIYSTGWYIITTQAKTRITYVRFRYIGLGTSFDEEYPLQFAPKRCITKVVKVQQNIWFSLLTLRPHSCL